MHFFVIYNHFNSKSNYLQEAVLPLRLIDHHFVQQSVELCERRLNNFSGIFGKACAGNDRSYHRVRTEC